MELNSSDIRGIVHGKTIELDRALGYPDGQPVTVTVRPVQEQLPRGEGIRRSAGAWADANQEEFDHWLHETQRLRQINRPELE